jgi:hypothetical protein
MQTQKLPKYAIRNFFMIRRFYCWFPIVSFLIFAIIGYLMNFYNSSALLIIPLLCFLLCLCISVELAKNIFQFTTFNRKKSGNKKWVIWQIIINSFVVISILVIFIFNDNGIIRF